MPPYLLVTNLNGMVTIFSSSSSDIFSVIIISELRAVLFETNSNRGGKVELFRRRSEDVDEEANGRGHRSNFERKAWQLISSFPRTVQPPWQPFPLTTSITSQRTRSSSRELLQQIAQVSNLIRSCILHEFFVCSPPGRCSGRCRQVF